MSSPADPPLSRRAARQAQATAQDAPPEGFAQPVTRRGRGGTPASVPSSAPSDVAYRTQVRPRVPHYDAAPVSHDVLPGSAPTPPIEHPESAPERLVEPPVAPPASYRTEQVRRRDFRPPADQRPQESTGAFARDVPLEYHTQGGPRTEAVAPPIVEAPSATEPPAMIEPSTTSGAHFVEPMAQLEQTLSRRELRALRAQLGLAPETAVEPTPDADLAADEAMAVEPATVIEPIAVVESPPAIVIEQPVVVEPIVVVEQPVVVEPIAVVEPPAVVVAPFPLAQPSVEPPRSSSSAPTGSHWTTGIHADDDPFENTFSREVGSTASLSTNALVLPEMPTGSISGPVSGTGEIIVTGMIDLSRVVSSTGTMPTVHESPDIDDLFEPGDLSAAPIDAAPVSALKAVSSHTGTQGVMVSSKRPSSNTVTTVLVASTVVMAVVAIGLFVLAAVNGLF